MSAAAARADMERRACHMALVLVWADIYAYLEERYPLITPPPGSTDISLYLPSGGLCRVSVAGL